ncbi:hypothetical protein AB0O87_06150 [Microbacterium sp. NPDC076768]|uniref:hypothetical protein n=1 Tax=Microbacterium sp. NPDC076768 TaxID=3154858 RepID=UPI003433640E
MDSGWAVVLGAVIALAGSAVIPWIREARAAQRRQEQLSADRLRDAIVELLAVNAGMAMAVISINTEVLRSTYAERQRAATRLLLEVPPHERQHISGLLSEALPTPTATGGGEPGTLHMTHALQEVLVLWASGQLDAAHTEDKLRSLLPQSS